MKARVKATGEIVDIAYTFKTVGKNPISKYETLKGKRYNEEDLDFNIEDDNTPDYWTCLEHQAAIAAMQGMVSNERCWEENADKIAEVAICYAKELVKGLRIERSN